MTLRLNLSTINYRGPFYPQAAWAKLIKLVTLTSVSSENYYTVESVLNIPVTIFYLEKVVNINLLFNSLIFARLKLRYLCSLFRVALFYGAFTRSI